MEMEQQEGIFKTAAFGGFDKKSVLTYIETLTEKHLAEEEELRRRMQEFSKAQDSQVAYIKKLESQVTDLEGKLEAVATQLETERSVSPHAASQINELLQKNGELEKQVDTLEQEVKLQAERSRQLQFKAESMTYKSQKYDEMSNQIGDAMLVAKSNADKMVNDAKKQAEDLCAQAEAKAAILTEQAEAHAAEIVQKADDDAAAAVSHAQAKAVRLTQQAREEKHRLGDEVGSFKGDAVRLRKSIEEILFVLNDRVDVMHEIVRRMEDRCADPEEEAGDSDYVMTEETPFEKAADEAGLFGELV